MLDNKKVYKTIDKIGKTYSIITLKVKIYIIF